MIKWNPATPVMAAILGLATCVPMSATACTMQSSVLDTATSGPLTLEVFGSDTLCIEPSGSGNLAAFVPTVRITNTGSQAVTIRYQLDPARSFRSTEIWPAGQRSSGVEYSEVIGGASAQSKKIRKGKELLISSWTRHNDTIRKNVKGKARDFVVRFDLAISYDSGSGPVAVSQSFDIPLRAIPKN